MKNIFATTNDRNLRLTATRVTGLVACVLAVLAQPGFVQSNAAEHTFQKMQMPTAAEVQKSWINPPSEYGPEPYFGMNGPVTIESLSHDLDTMKSLGFHTVTAQAGGGMTTTYLSPEYFAFFKQFIAEAKKRDMRVWIVDDIGYPSGFAGGKFANSKLSMQALTIAQRLPVKAGATLTQTVSANAVAAIATSASGERIAIPIKDGNISWTAPANSDTTVAVVEHVFRTSPTKSDTNPTHAKDSTQPLEDYLLIGRVDRMHRAQVAPEHHAARVLERVRLAISLGGELAVAEVVAQASAVPRPVLVERGDREHIRDVDLVDELVCLIDEALDQIQPIGVDGGDFIHVDGTGNAADKVVRMRILATEDRVDLDDLLLPHQRVQIVGHGDQVDLRRQLVGRMPPIAVGEDAQPVGGERLDLVLHVREIRGRVLVPFGERLRQLRGLLRISLQGVDDIHPVQCVQVIEVNHVVLHVLRGHHDVADQLRSGWDGDAQRAFHGAHASQGVHRGAHAAYALGDCPGIARIAADQDFLQAAHHGAR